MQHLWAPWRMTYIQKDDKGEEGCVFCLPDSSQLDCERLVLLRSEHAFVIMNKYPYTNGHLMVAPFRHTADIGQLLPEEAADMHRLLVQARNVLKEAVSPQGFNIGMNLGQIAGAGVADHLHMHIVPRWSGDTNFMPVFSDVRVIPQHLEETYACLKQVFDKQSC